MEETVPEIQRTNLSNTVLYLKALGILDVLGFDFLDAPSQEQLSDALVALHVLGALDDRGGVTAVGLDMSRLPVEPNVARMLVHAAASQQRTVVEDHACDRAEAGCP
jgi:HrpA-like RNA helicase